MTAGALFDMTPIAQPEPPPADESADRRRTRKQRERIATGLHPLAALLPGLRLHPDAGRPIGPEDPRTGPVCGSCAHRLVGGYPKCGRMRALRSFSAASDCRAWWPGCTEWTEATP